MARGGWSSVPAELLNEVSARLSSDADLLHIHQVCTHWRSSTSILAAFRPWILAGRGRWLGPICDYSLRLPRRGAQRMQVGVPPAGLPYCLDTSLGWLALVDHESSPTRLVLWEPLSNTEIPLPCLNPSRIFLSDDPLTSSNWTAIATQSRVGESALVWRPGDATWTLMFGYGNEFENITFNKGKAYCIDCKTNIIICDLNTAGSDLPPKCTRIFDVRSVVNMLCWRDHLQPVCSIHLVTCNGDMMLVVLRSLNYPSWAQVYKPELSGTDQRLQLHDRERVTDLGDYSLFLGKRGHSFALSAKEFPAIKRNCIYYAHKPFFKSHWIYVFHLASNTAEEIPYPEELKHGEAKWKPYAWFCPRAAFLKQQ